MIHLVENASQATSQHKPVSFYVCRWIIHRKSAVTHFIYCHINPIIGRSFFDCKVMGVLEASVLCLHDPLDLVKGFVIDDLHCLFLGVTKHMLGLIKSTDHTTSILEKRYYYINFKD